MSIFGGMRWASYPVTKLSDSWAPGITWDSSSNMARHGSCPRASDLLICYLVALSLAAEFCGTGSHLGARRIDSRTNSSLEVV